MKRILALVLSVLMLASCFVIATSAEEADLAAVYAGAQTKAYTTADGDFYDVRFLATLDETALTNKKVVFTITATYGAGEQVFEVDTDTVYTSVLSGTNTVAPSAFKAEHEYFAAVAVKGISKAAYGNVVFTVSIKAVAADDSDVASAGNNFVSFNGGAEVKGALVPVSFAFDSGNKHNNPNTSADTIFDTKDTTTLVRYNNSKIGYVAGAFAVPTVITKITYYSTTDNYANRARNNTLEGSVDGENWVTLAKLPNPVTSSTVYTFDIVDNTPYNYLRIYQVNSGEYWDIGTIAVEGIELAQTPLNVTPHSANVAIWKASDGVNPNDGGSVETVWDITDTNSKTTSYAPGAGNSPRWIAGKFDKATVINKVVYYAPPSNGNRARGGTIEASVDGTTWVKIATMNGSGTMYEANDVLVMDITDTTEYNYIRIVQGPNYVPYDWSVGTIVVY